MVCVEKVQKFYDTETSQTLNLNGPPHYVAFISGVRYINFSTRECFLIVLFDAYVYNVTLYLLLRPSFLFFFFFPPFALSQRHSSESIQLSGRLLYINAECICAKVAIGTKLKKMSQEQQYKKNVKGLRQTLKAGKLAVCRAFQRPRHHRGRHLTTFLVPLMQPTC